MSTSFYTSEIIQFAIRIEENGEEFYRLMSKKVGIEGIRNVFNYLADEEVKHRKVFQELASKIEKYEPAESYPGEYLAYLRAFADELIFTKEKKGQLIAKQIKTVKDAVEFAIEMELNSILYYLETKNLVPVDQRGTIDKIIEEERSHYLKLLELKRK